MGAEEEGELKLSGRCTIRVSTFNTDTWNVGPHAPPPPSSGRCTAPSSSQGLLRVGTREAEPILTVEFDGHFLMVFFTFLMQLAMVSVSRQPTAAFVFFRSSRPASQVLANVSEGQVGGLPCSRWKSVNA